MVPCILQLPDDFERTGILFDKLVFRNLKSKHGRPQMIPFKDLVIIGHHGLVEKLIIRNVEMDARISPRENPFPLCCLAAPLKDDAFDPSDRAVLLRKRNNLTRRDIAENWVVQPHKCLKEDTFSLCRVENRLQRNVNRMILKAPLNCLLDEKTSVNTGDISLPRLRLGIRRTVSGVPGKIGIQTVNTLRVFRDPDRNDRGGHIHIRPAFQPPVPAGTLADHCQGIVNFLLVRFLEKNHKIEVVVVENLIDVELSGQRTAGRKSEPLPNRSASVSAGAGRVSESADPRDLFPDRIGFHPRLS